MAAAYPHFLVSETLTTVAPPRPMVTPAASPPFLTQDELKKIATYKAVEQVHSGMVVGLGISSTAKHAVDRIDELMTQGELNEIVGIATSMQTYEQAASLGIPLSDLDTYPIVDLSIDGADEVDPDLNLVKGRGGSLLREKMVESASRKFIVIVDESKLVSHIGGSVLAMPVEVIPFYWSHSRSWLKALLPDAGCAAKQRTRDSDEAYVSDNGNYIIDLYFEREIGDLNKANDRILRLAGIVEHGMFIGLASSVIVAGIVEHGMFI